MRHDGDTARVRSLRLACLAALGLSVCFPQVAAACLPPAPLAPPSQGPAESDAEFQARKAKWYGDIAERQRQESLPRWIAREDRLWAKAERIVLAWVVKVGETRLRGSEGQWYMSPLVTLKPIRWLKGRSSASRLRVHYLSDNSCDFGGVGDAPDGEVGEPFLLFYRKGPPDPRNILDTIGRDRAVTERTRGAFE